MKEPPLLGAALSTTFGGKLIQHYNFGISFLALGAVAAIAFVLLWFAVPETLGSLNNANTSFHPVHGRQPHEQQSLL